MTRPSGRLVIVLVALAALLPCLLAPWPPSYDYYHWLFHGHALAKLLQGDLSGPEPVTDLFALHARPVPNMAVSLGMTALNFLLAPRAAAWLYLVVAVLLFGFGFLVLTRTVQGRPTAVELFGFAWAYGYLMYAGYVGNLLSLGLGFFALAAVQRLLLRSDPPRPVQVLGLGLLIALVYCAHLFAWMPVVTALGFGSLALVWRRGAPGGDGRPPRRRWRHALAMLAALVPSFVLLGWYMRSAWVTVVGPETQTEKYSSAGDKGISLLDPLLLFLRPDPLDPVLPVLWSNLVALTLLAVVVLWSLRGGRADDAAGRRLGPVLATAVFFLLVAFTWPFGTLDGMGRPDERLELPGILLLLASLPYRRASARALALAALPVLAVLGLRAAEFHAGSRRIDGLLSAIRQKVAADRPWIAITIWEGRVRGGCQTDARWPSVGQPTLKWVSLARAAETDRLRTTVMESGFLTNIYPYDRYEDLAVFIMKRDVVRRWAMGNDLRGYPSIVLLGCQADRLAAEPAFARSHQAAVRDRDITILERRP